jgi:hypothetical protein
MKTILPTSIALAVATAPAVAGVRYDRKLEQAAMQIVAGKIGDIRGGFSYKQKPRFVVVQDVLVAPAPAGGETASPSVVEPARPPRS